MIRHAAGSIGGKEIITQAELLRIGPVIRDVGLRVLDLTASWKLVQFATVQCRQRSSAPMIEVRTHGIAGLRLDDAVCAWEGTKEVIKGVVFLHNENDMLDGSR